MKHIKRNAHLVREGINDLIQNDYMKGVSILSIAKKINYPPSMVTRLIVETITSFDRKKVTDSMRRPFQILTACEILDEFEESEQVEEEFIITDTFFGKPFQFQEDRVTRIAKEVTHALNSDPLYGPRFDQERRFIGLEYEIILEQSIHSMRIPFETEGELRKRGTARTPDVLFSCPIAIKVIASKISSSLLLASDENSNERSSWKTICWIDSKALFGDEETHQKSVLPQAESYVHRFGPGLILYWFGHAPIHKLGDGNGDVVVTGWNVPEVFMLPTGEIRNVV